MTTVGASSVQLEDVDSVSHFGRTDSCCNRWPRLESHQPVQAALTCTLDEQDWINASRLTKLGRAGHGGQTRMLTQEHLYKKAGNHQISCMQPATLGYMTIWDPRSPLETLTEASPLDASRAREQAPRHSNQSALSVCPGLPTFWPGSAKRQAILIRRWRTGDAG